VKNIQVIDSAQNAVYDIFAAPAHVDLVFLPGTAIAFSQEIATRPDADKVFDVLNGIWGSRLAKTDVVGTHRTLFYGLRHKRQYYPTLRDEAINPHGTRLR